MHFSALPLLERLVAATRLLNPTQHSPLQQEIAALGSNPDHSRLSVLHQRVIEALETDLAQIQGQILAVEQKRSKELELKQKAQQLLQKGLNESLLSARSWLSPPHLVELFAQDAAQALMRMEFEEWQTFTLSQEWQGQIQPIQGWMNKLCTFFKLTYPGDLTLRFPVSPVLLLEDPLEKNTPSKTNVTPIAIAAGVGLVLAGPLGAAVLGGASYWLTQSEDSDKPSGSSAGYEDKVASVCWKSANQYLKEFSNLALSALQVYETRAQTLMEAAVSSTAQIPLEWIQQQQTLQSALNEVRGLI